MKTCDHKHSPNVICCDRRCYWGQQNKYIRLLRRFDRLQSENVSLRETLAKRRQK